MKATMRPLNILYFTSSREIGGAERHMVSLIHDLNREAFEPIVACPAILAEQMQSDLRCEIEFVPIDLRSPFDFPSAMRLACQLRAKRIDILHSHLFRSSLFASPIGRLAGVPAIIETPHVSERWRRGWLKGRFVVDRFAARCVDALIAVSQANARYLAEQKGLPKDKIHVVPNGVDLGRFRPGCLRLTPMRQSLGLRAEDPVLVCVARLELQKGHRVLLDAMVRLRVEIPGVRLMIVGDGSLRSDLERNSRDLGLEPAVRFVGWQENVEDWLALANVVVLPSFYEGLPLAALEALAMQKPLVATRVDGTPEVVLHNRTGLTVPPGNPVSLADAIVALLRDPARAQALARAGRRLVSEKFTIARQVRATEALYRETWRKGVTQRAFIPSAPVLARDPWRDELP